MAFFSNHGQIFIFPTPPLDFTRDHAADTMSESPIVYVKNAKLRGKLFSPDETDGLICGVDSTFFVDHSEPFEALMWFRENNKWPLGDFPDGHEFLFTFERPRRRWSRSLSSSR